MIMLQYKTHLNTSRIYKNCIDDFAISYEYDDHQD